MSFLTNRQKKQTISKKSHCKLGLYHHSKRSQSDCDTLFRRSKNHLLDVVAQVDHHSDKLTWLLTILILFRCYRLDFVTMSKIKL